MSTVNDGHAVIGNIVQILIMAGLLGWSLFFMLRRMAPNFVHNRQTQLASMFHTWGWEKLALWLEPTLNTGGGCGSGCNTCGTCPSNPNKAPIKESVQTVQWKQPPPTATPPKSSGCH